MLEWNVYVSNFNRKKIEVHNVFEHTRFLEDCKAAARKYSKDKAAFAEAVRKDLMYYYWSKCEWEVIIDHWPPRSDVDCIKVDVYDQVVLNWDRFIDYVWEHAAELRRREKKND